MTLSAQVWTGHFRPYSVHRHPGGHVLHPQLHDEAAALYRMRRAECGFRGDGLRRPVLAAGKYPDGGGIVTTSGRYMDTVWLLIETDETKQQGRTRRAGR